MRTIAAQSSISITSTASYKTYAGCVALLVILTIANVAASVRSMYVGQASYESASAVQQLQKDIKQLEIAHSSTQSLAEIKSMATAEGFTAVEEVQFVSVPTSQAVAQR